MVNLAKLAPGLAKIIKPATDVIVRNSPKILLATGIAGFVSTVVMAVKATPEGYAIHEKYESERSLSPFLDGRDQKDIWLDEFKDQIAVYWPTVLMGVASIACIIGSSHIQAKRGAALLAAYSLTEQTLETYQSKVIEKLGEETHKDILQKTSDEIVEDPEEPPFKADTVYVNKKDDGKEWFRDGFTGRYFRSTTERIREAESTINKRLSSEVTVNLREFWYELGLEDDMLAGEGFGWIAGQCPLDVYFTKCHKGTPMEYTHLGYHYVLLDPRIFERGR